MLPFSTILPQEFFVVMITEMNVDVSLIMDCFLDTNLGLLTPYCRVAGYHVALNIGAIWSSDTLVCCQLTT
jgi:hypothetical protein